MIYRSKAPLRVSFGGGGTDISPYCDRNGGLVLSSTINKYCFGTLRPRSDREVQVRSLDYDLTVRYQVDEDPVYDGKLDLVKASIKHMGPVPRGFDLYLYSDAPPGSGLGSSSTLVVTVLGCLQRWLGRRLSPYQLADLAYRVEREEMGIKGGRQDQYAAVFGGFNLIEFEAGHTVVNPLRLRPEVVNELEANLLLCYTGKTRVSASIIESQVRSCRNEEPNTMAALNRLKELTVRLKNSLLQEDLDEFGELLHEAWVHKKRLAPAITDREIDGLYQAALESGATGGKLLGAGGGGYLLLFCPPHRRHLVVSRLEKLSGQAVSFAFEWQGLQTWEVATPAPRLRETGGGQ